MGLVDSGEASLEPGLDGNIVLKMDVVAMKTCRRREWKSPSPGTRCAAGLNNSQHSLRILAISF